MKKTCCRCGCQYKSKIYGYGKATWELTRVASLQDRCKQCYQRGYDRKLASLKRHDPSSDDVIYRLDERDLVWTEPRFINQCQACHGQIMISTDYLEERDQYILCRECNPSSYCRKYYWSCGRWYLYKIRTLINGMHRWRRTVDARDWAYSCRCDRCLIAESKETELVRSAAQVQLAYDLRD
jgi:hypothetical protein